jgi:hypothetical protein
MSTIEYSATPCLLVCKELLKPVMTAYERIINKIQVEASKGSCSEIVREGLFVLAVASVETMLADTLRYYLKHFPIKLNKKEFTLNKEQLVSWKSHLLDSQVDQEIMGFSYESLRSMLKGFKEKLSLDNDIPQMMINEMIEIKERRNLLLHNNLIMNATYKQKAGPLAEKADSSGKLAIDAAYLDKSLNSTAGFCQWIEAQLSAKYASYTRIAAIKRLWQFLFKSPVMVFEDYWQLDEERDEVVAYKGSTYEDQGLLSNSEMMFLGVWQSHFHGIPHSIDNLLMYSLDPNNRRKMVYFLTILSQFRLE